MIEMLFFVVAMTIMSACVCAAYLAECDEEGTMELVDEPEGSFYRWEPIVK